MDREEFERLIDQVVSSQQAHPCGASLPGGSPAMSALAEDLARVRAELARPPAEHRCGVVFLHPPRAPLAGSRTAEAVRGQRRRDLRVVPAQPGL